MPAEEWRRRSTASFALIESAQENAYRVQRELALKPMFRESDGYWASVWAKSAVQCVHVASRLLPRDTLINYAEIVKKNLAHEREMSAG